MNTKNKTDSLLSQNNETIIGECKLNSSATDNLCKLTLFKKDFISNAKHVLVFKVTISKQTTTNHHHLTNGNANDYNSYDKEELQVKKRKLNELNRFRAELVILGNNQECLLKDGEYYLTLNECNLTTNGDNGRTENIQDRFKKIVYWESESKLNSTFQESTTHEPYLSFYLNWSNTGDLLNNNNDTTTAILQQQQIKPYLINNKTNQLQTQPLKQIDPPNTENSNKSSSYSKNSSSKKFNNNSNSSSLHLNGCTTTNGFNNANVNNNNCSTTNSTTSTALAKSKDSMNGHSMHHQTTQQTSSSSKVIYRFFYNNNVLQQTKAPSEFKCPWCGLYCLQIFSLKNHLKYNHNRFNFIFMLDNKGYKIDVTINEQYDGSYCGNPHHDLANLNPKEKKKPAQRTPVTHILVNLRGDGRQILNEFLANENESMSDFDLIKPQVFGHNRLYYHSGTCQPIKPHELDQDSEDEKDPEWMQIKTQLVFDYLQLII